MSIRTERLANIFVEEISKIIASEIHDENISFVTITHAKVSSDLSYAKVYFSVLDLDRIKITEDTLNKASGFIRSEMCKRVDNLRKMPYFTFIYDDSIAIGQKIEDIIGLLKEEEIDK